jgi:hypothetical protein
VGVAEALVCVVLAHRVHIVFNDLILVVFLNYCSFGVSSIHV